MMSDQPDFLDNIDIEGKRLAVSSTELDRLKSTQGCALNMVTSKVFTLDDTAESDEDDQIFDDEKVVTPVDRKDKMDRMNREFLSLILNANRDLIKHGPRDETHSILEYGEEIDPEETTLSNSINDRFYSDVHRLHEYKNNHEEQLKNETKPYQEISPGVFKSVMNIGVGPPVTLETMVIYNCAMWIEASREPFDSTWLRRTATVSNLQTDSILPGIFHLLIDSRRGEWSKAILKPEAAFGKLGVMPRIPPNASIFCIIEIVKVVSRDKLSIILNPEQNYKFDDLLVVADEGRKRGNYFYETKQYKIALQRYKSAIRILDGITYKDESEEKRGQEMLLKLYSNSARCFNASGNPRLALGACKLASMIDDINPKIFWHRMCAWNLKGHTDKALSVAHRALQVFNHGKEREAFKNKIEELNKKILLAENESRELYKLMAKSILS